MDKVPPQSLEAESCVLGSMLLMNECIPDVVQVLRPEQFYKSANQIIFDHAMHLHDGNQPVDLVTLRDSLTKADMLEQVGGIGYLMELPNTVPSAANVIHYANIVREKSSQRGLINTCSDIVREAYDCEDPDALIERAEREIFEIGQKRLSGEVVELNKILIDLTNELEAMKDRDGRISGVSTGFFELDDLTGGLHESELIILAARPSMGKTTLALNIIDKAAVQDGKKIAFFSAEMARRQVVLNMVCARAEVNTLEIRRGFISDVMMEKIIQRSPPLYEARIFIDDTPGISVSQLRAKARRLKAKEDIDLIVVDYLQLLSASADSREQEISLISRSLKTVARELQIPVLVLAQLNRQVEGRADHKPMLSDLRESGSIEQDADVIMFLSREDYYDPGNAEKKGQVTLTIAKQRNGPTGAIKLMFRSEIMKFVPFTGREEDY